jgi:heat shock protein HtpX
MTVAGFLATVAGLLIRFGFYSGLGGGRSRDNSAAVFGLVVLVSVIVYVLSFLLLRALSRYREYADRPRRGDHHGRARPAGLGAGQDHG